MTEKVTIAVVMFLAVSAFCLAGACKAKHQSSCPKTCQKSSATGKKTSPDKKQAPKKDKLDDILSRLTEQTSSLKSYQAKIEYLFIQDPELLDSRTLRKGRLYYKKDEAGSKLQVNFDTLKQDDADEEKHVEQFIFDGVWLTRIDYQLEKVDFYQQAEEDKPIDVFEFISHRFPMVGFTKTGHLRKQFEIAIIPQKQSKSSNRMGLRLKTKKDSIYRDDYTTIDFWIDNESLLPAKLVATSIEGDIYDIQLLDTKVNKKIKNTVFKVETPEHFRKNREPLKRR
jgi:outer membrane lipoprotein-sorting protein